MGLVRVSQASALAEGERLVKECYNLVLLVTKTNGTTRCIGIPDPSYATQDLSVLEGLPQAKVFPIHQDVDGQIWVNIGEEILGKSKDSKRVDVDVVEVDPEEVPPPPPLIPYGGLDRKPMPPSPMKMGGSPGKGTPTKIRDRPEGERMTRMGPLFGGRIPTVEEMDV